MASNMIIENSLKLKWLFKYFGSVATVLCILSTVYAEGEDRYVPAPIVFVHGFGSSEGAWDQAKGELRKYFEDANGQKYDYLIDDEIAYFPHCDYNEQSNSDIPTIARTELCSSIIKGLKYIPECPSSEKKVNIVAHSMGGLVTRALFK